MTVVSNELGRVLVGFTITFGYELTNGVVSVFVFGRNKLGDPRSIFKLRSPNYEGANWGRLPIDPSHHRLDLRTAQFPVISQRRSRLSPESAPLKSDHCGCCESIKARTGT